MEVDRRQFWSNPEKVESYIAKCKGPSNLTYCGLVCGNQPRWARWRVKLDLGSLSCWWYRPTPNFSFLVALITAVWQITYILYVVTQKQTIFLVIKVIWHPSWMVPPHDATVVVESPSQSLSAWRSLNLDAPSAVPTVSPCISIWAVLAQS